MKRLPLFVVLRRKTTEKSLDNNLLEMLHVGAGLIHKWLPA
jgi:hypothetical protein